MGLYRGSNFWILPGVWVNSSLAEGMVRVDAVDGLGAEARRNLACY